MRNPQRIRELTTEFASAGQPHTDFREFLDHLIGHLDNNNVAMLFYLEDDKWMAAARKMPHLVQAEPSWVEFFDHLTAAWERYPDLRFWQFIEYVASRFVDTDFNDYGEICNSSWLRIFDEMSEAH